VHRVNDHIDQIIVDRVNDQIDQMSVDRVNDQISVDRVNDQIEQKRERGKGLQSAKRSAELFAPVSVCYGPELQPA